MYVMGCVGENNDTFIVHCGINFLAILLKVGISFWNTLGVRSVLHRQQSRFRKRA